MSIFRFDTENPKLKSFIPSLSPKHTKSFTNYFNDTYEIGYPNMFSARTFYGIGPRPQSSAYKGYEAHHVGFHVSLIPLAHKEPD